MIALPVGGFVTILATRSWSRTAESLTFGLEKMSGVAILLVGTGTIAGIIKASEIKDVLIAMLSGWEAGEKAEFYCDVQAPDFGAAHHYFRVTDTQMLKAFLGKKSSHIYSHGPQT
jgi:hypothetical protein